MNEKVIYFSLNPVRKASFYRYVKTKGLCYEQKFSFSLEGENDSFSDPRDLIPLIERNSNKDTLHIIIDYVSCCGTGKETNYSTVLRDIIMCYPEVQFLFDETFVRKDPGNIKEIEDPKRYKYDFSNFLFWHTKKMESVFTEFHQFDLKDLEDEYVKKQFIRLLKGCNNMYDASNLRYAIKRYKREELSVNQNYKNLQESRSKHVAVVVEEEYHQNMFNGYCLYACGFRVFPIVSATELRWINEVAPDELKKEGEPLLLRDYDLQFVDENRVEQVHGDSDNEVDYIRGAKIDKHTGKYALVEKDVSDAINPYWKAFSGEMTYFVSKGEQTIDIDLKDEKDIPLEKHMEVVGEGGQRLQLRGIKKPMEGIYASIRRIPVVKERYNESREKEDNPFIISRQEVDGHSCPLDIYGIARSMVHRSECYYQNGRHRLAALVAGEALEVLNGFHKSLMKRAYYVQAVSENAMAMSLLGGSEGRLREDVKFRLKTKVREDMKRMIEDESDRFNVLYNIFNDCLLFCREKEYFLAADEALSIMVNEKDGWHYKDCWKSLKAWFARVFMSMLRRNHQRQSK